VLRVFDAAGQQVALDDQEGGDPSLSFQAGSAGDYFVGVSSAGNDAYDPGTGSSQAGTTTGLYALNLRLTHLTAGAPAQADVTASSFRIASQIAVWGDTLTGTYRVENRGGAPASGFAVALELADNNLFDGSSNLQVLAPVLSSATPTGLTADQGYLAAFSVQLPASAPAGFSASGPVYLGLVITPGTKDANKIDKAGVHRGEDWETLTVVTPISASGSNHSPASADVLPDLNSRINGVLTPGQEDWYRLTVSQPGGLTVRVTPAGNSTLLPRLTLPNSAGQLLIQSDDASVRQHLQPGVYYLVVSARSGAGSYQLLSEFVQASPPFEALPVGRSLYPASAVAVADVNGDGKPDLVVANFDGTVSVLLGNGDGSFQSQQTFALGPPGRPVAVVVADVNGDGKPDLVVAWGGIADAVGVLLGNGDGSFRTGQSLGTYGRSPLAVAVADVNGDGKPDLVVAYQSDLYKGVYVLPGNGDGSFQTQQTFTLRSSLRSLAVADVNGDGKPDLVVDNFSPPLAPPGNTVSVLLGNGAGSFKPKFGALFSR
jgi:hypothetical protein